MTDSSPWPSPPDTSAARRYLEDRLRPATGIFSTQWSAAEPAISGSADVFDLRELFPLCLAWRAFAPDVARELVLSAVAAQHPSGAFPCRLQPDGQVVSRGAPWPLLAQAADVAAGELPPVEFVAVALPAVERHVEWALKYYRAGEGPPTWPTAEEAWLPEVWSSELRTVDLTAMLAAEIEACISLAERSNAGGAVSERFGGPLKRLRGQLESFFFDAASGLYLDRNTGGAAVSRRTVSMFLPLLTAHLAPPVRRRLEAELMRWYAPEAGGFPLWESWADDPEPPPVRPLQQAVLWAALLRGGETASAGELRRRAAAGGGFGGGLAGALAAAPVLSVSATGWSIWKPGRRRAAIAAALVATGLLGATGLLMMRRPTLPGATGEALLNLARERSRSGDHEQAIGLYRQFLAMSKSTNGTIRVLLGNALYRAERYEEAEREYRLAMLEEVSALHALYNLGLALHRQGRDDEAARALEQFVGTYRGDFPELANRARVAAAIIRGEPLRIESLP